ncbi:MAG: type IV secretion system DNA-binding domain-containing protein [Inquilinus sp.]|uniref:type IV secretion system DNA-binding domain-containing protein n=1 Tax=Inquilinus sp. TaxID=1932117 RepID=UPI003F3C2874
MSRSGRKSRVRWGWIAFCTVAPIFLLLAGMTLAYPIAAGALRVGQAGLGSWISYGYREGQWLIGWSHVVRYSGDPLVWKAVGLAGAFTIVALAGVSFILVMLLWQPAKQPDLERRHLRGSRLIEKRDMPDEIIELAASALHGAGSKEMRAWAHSARDIEADAEEERRILEHALKNGRPLTPGEARAEARVNAIGRAAVRDGLVRFGNLPLPRQLETLHGLICASTGTGKSVALRQLLADIRRRGDRAIVVDAGYDMSESFRRQGDKVLSPFDSEAVGWNLRNEIKAPHEWQTYAASLFPDQAGESGEWARRARIFFANAAMRAGAQMTNSELFKMITQSDVAELQATLEAESSATFQKGAEGILGSVRSIIETNLAAWQFTRDGDFSCREYMLGEDPGWLWLPYRDTEKGVLGPSIGAWLDILILAGLERASVKDGRFPRTWIVIDELDSIGAINSLKDAVTRLRKSNIAVVCAIQDYGQLVERYGAQTASTLFGCFSNRLFLRCNSSDLAEKASKEIGLAEMEETRVQAGQSANNVGSRTTTGVNATTMISIVKQEIVMASELQHLPTLEGFVTLADRPFIYPVTQTLWPDVAAPAT